jgi:hypothetical protein
MIRKILSMLMHSLPLITHCSLLIAFSLFLLLSCQSLTFASLDSDWGGHIKVKGSTSWIDKESILKITGDSPYNDGYLEARIKNILNLSEDVYLESHYEAVILGGDTKRKTNELVKIVGLPIDENLFFFNQVNDDRRLFNLTKITNEENNYIAYQRLDRLCLTLKPKWGMISIGRQALTWGNGLLFNPMDLFNPFSPTDIEKDYKTGDDMVVAQWTIKPSGDIQLLYVPRRDLSAHDIQWDQSSLAGKWHFAVGKTELDIMGAKHYNDYIVGVGSTGYLMSAAWRMDGTWTFLREDFSGKKDKEGFFAFVVNLDYSWAWFNKNFYGFIEYYHNGLGESEYINAITNNYLTERLLRGEIFTLGRNYLSCLVQIELHPLFNFYLTTINNIFDPSGIIVPRAIWGMTQNIQVTMGANLSWGSKNTEYGGINIPFTDFYLKSPDSAFVWMTWFY